MLIGCKRRIRVETVEAFTEEASWEARKEDIKEEEVKDMVGEEVDSPPISTMVRQAAWRISVPSPMHCVDITTTYTMSWRITQGCWKNGKKNRGVATW
jgi:hypothetical protein